MESIVAHLPVWVSAVVGLLFLLAFVYVLLRQRELSLRCWFEYAFLARIQLFTIILLVGFAWAVGQFTPGLMANLLILNSPFEVALIAFLAILAAWTCYFTLRTLARAAPDRLEHVPRLSRPQDRIGQIVTSGVFFVLAAVPMVVIVFLASEEVPPGRRLTAILAGTLAAVACALIHVALSRRFGSLNHWLEAQTKRIPQSWLEGVFKGYELRAGHASATVYFLITFVVYVLGFLFYVTIRPRAGFAPPALAYLLLLLILMCWALAGLAMFLDRYRQPVLLAVAAFAVAIWLVGEGDNYYPLQPIPQPQASSAVAPSSSKLGPKTALRAWNEKHDDNLPLVVVMASGGGIKAAGWTMSVLQALQTWLGEEFAGHIVLISSVSGGSAGVMYYMDVFQDGEPPTAEELEYAVQSALRPSLADAVWGLVYPDLWRIGIGSRVRNRGWAMEQAWRRAMLNPDATLHDWRAEVRSGDRPPVLFNATIMDNGTPFVFSPLDDMDDGDTPRRGEWRSRYFNTTYPTYTVLTSTAARMSATFPYVSPISAPLFDSQPVSPTFRLADGGYFDNYGIVSALEWLDAVTPVIREQGRTVILVRIEASLFMPEGLRNSYPEPHGLDTIAGPALGALKSLFTAQKWRNDQAINQIARPLSTQSGVINQVSPNIQNLNIRDFTFAYSGTASLSWQLSVAESNDIRCSINEERMRQIAQNLCSIFYSQRAPEGITCQNLPSLVDLGILKAEQCKGISPEEEREGMQQKVLGEQTER